MFIFCFLDLQCTIPYPKYMQPSVWIFKSGCTPYAASTHVQNWLRLSAPIVLLSSIFCFRYFNTRLKFAFSSLVLLVTLVHSNDMVGSMLGLPIFATRSNFATMECRIYASLFSILVELSSMFFITLFYGDYNFAFRSSPNKSIYSSM